MLAKANSRGSNPEINLAKLVTNPVKVAAVAAAPARQVILTTPQKTPIVVFPETRARKSTRPGNARKYPAGIFDDPEDSLPQTFGKLVVIDRLLRG